MIKAKKENESEAFQQCKPFDLFRLVLSECGAGD